MTQHANPQTPLAKLIQDWLDSTGNTAASLARASGIHAQTVLNLINPERSYQMPQSRTLAALAKGMRVPLDTIKEAAVNSSRYAHAIGGAADDPHNLLVDNSLFIRLAALTPERQQMVLRRLAAMEYEQSQEQQQVDLPHQSGR